MLVIADGTEARMGSLSADAERFMQWRTIGGVTIDPLGQFNELETLIRGGAGSQPAAGLPPLLHPVRGRWWADQEDRQVSPVPCRPCRRAAGADRVHARRHPWHTQGSGKSITMTCFAARILREPAMENPTIVVITDRNDLDGQLFGVFSLAQDLLREQPVQIEKPPGPARQAGQSTLGRDHLYHHPEIHAGVVRPSSWLPAVPGEGSRVSGTP
jgi:type I restriction enzyme R subunit